MLSCKFNIFVPNRAIIRYMYMLIHINCCTVLYTRKSLLFTLILYLLIFNV
jgi:hypothetical protein